MATGYRHATYARSFNEIGHARLLPQSKGWCLKRPIRGTSDWDAMGCYPIFACEAWDALSEDLEQLKDEVVSIAMVTDPFGTYCPSLLRSCFRDVVVPFKEHYVVDLSQSLTSVVSAHHRRNIRKAASQVDVERCEAPTVHVEIWCDLYHQLIQRHQIHGIAAFSREALARQLAVPGVVAFLISFTSDQNGAPYSNKNVFETKFEDIVTEKNKKDQGYLSDQMVPYFWRQSS